MRVDHTRLIREPAYRARVRRRIAAASASGKLLSPAVQHDADCCRIEPWPTTYAKLLAPLLAEMTGRNAGDVAAVLAEHEPNAVFVRKRDAVTEAVAAALKQGYEVRSASGDTMLRRTAGSEVVEEPLPPEIRAIQKAVDHRDKAWFVAHPTEAQYVRPYVIGELYPDTPEADADAATLRVIVYKISATARARELLLPGELT